MLSMHKYIKSRRPGTIRTTHYSIDSRDETRLICQQPYRAGKRSQEVLREQKQQEAGAIRPAQLKKTLFHRTSPQKHITLWFCEDFQRLNADTISNIYPPPRMNDCIHSLKDAKVYSFGRSMGIFASTYQR